MEASWNILVMATYYGGVLERISYGNILVMALYSYRGVLEHISYGNILVMALYIYGGVLERLRAGGCVLGE